MSLLNQFPAAHLDVEQGLPTTNIYDPAVNDEINPNDKNSSYTVDRKTKIIRLVVLVLGIGILALGRAEVPVHDVSCIVDRLMNVFDSWNAYVVNNPFLRKFLLIVCSLFMDITFLSTGIYWIFKGTTSRIFVAIPLFYGTRALVQLMWYSPFPSGYYWEYPGFPSLVVQYGKSTDFFFSGHIGFVVLNMAEWIMNGKPWIAFIIAMGGVYTILVLLVFQGHYSIDIFTGIVVAALIFILVDKYKDKLDWFFHWVYVKISGLFNRNRDNNLQENLMDPEEKIKYSPIQV